MTNTKIMKINKQKKIKNNNNNTFNKIKKKQKNKIQKIKINIKIIINKIIKMNPNKRNINMLMNSKISKINKQCTPIQILPPFFLKEKKNMCD